jgi:hypothetical protein
MRITVVNMSGAFVQVCTNDAASRISGNTAASKRAYGVTALRQDGIAIVQLQHALVYAVASKTSARVAGVASARKRGCRVGAGS